VNLLKTKDLYALVEYLLKTDYGPEISKISSESINSMKLSHIFYLVLMSRVYHLTRLAPRDVKEFLTLYAERYVVENVKRILRAKRTKSQINANMLLPIPREYALINFSAMVEAPTLQGSWRY
jgi:vacuolar-type H+-ATPase subunit C/Vma6